MKQYPFEIPEDKYRGLDLWMVNDKLEDEEIERQVKEFREKGLYSVIFRTYNGLISDYPGPEFKHKIRVAIEAAKKCGLKIALQAGYMPSAFPALPREFALRRIAPIPETELTDQHVVLCRYDGFAFTEEIAAATVNMLSEDAINYYIRVAYEEMWAEFADEFGKTVISVWLDEPRFDNRCLTWTPDFEEVFTERYGYSIKEKIPSLYFDIDDYKKIRYDYFTMIRDLMAKYYFTKARDWCHKNGLRFSGHLMGEEYLSTQISQAGAVMPFYKYFDVPGVDMLSAYHDWYDKPIYPLYQGRQRYTSRSMRVSAIQCTSAAEQSGKELKLCEMYALTSPGFTFRDQMHMFDFFAANGINHQCMHALFYSPRGFRKRFYPQTFNVYQPFWEDFRNVKDYVASVSSFISMGQSGADVAVLHPLETAYGLFRGLLDPEDPSNRNVVDHYDHLHYQLITQLYSSQIEFHFADPSTIDGLGSVDKDRFNIGKMSYGTLVLADIEVITTKTYDLINDFAKNGGKIYIKGMLPSRLDGRATPELEQWFASLPGVRRFDSNEALIRALKKDKSEKWNYVCNADISKTVINHRIQDGNHYFLIHNGDCRKEKHGSMQIAGIHKAYTFDATTKQITELGTMYENGKTIIPFTNPVGVSTMLFTVPDKEATVGHIPQTYYTCLPIQNVSCRVSGENVLTLENCCYKTEKMDDFSEKENVIERVVERLNAECYEGNITLRFAFQSDFEAKNIKLALEDAEEYKIKFNGTDVNSDVCGYYYSTAFQLIKLPDVTRKGENIIEISRYTKPQIARKPTDDMKHLFELFRSPVGVDLERIHLLGEFNVDAVPEYSVAPGLVRFGKRFFLTPKQDVETACDITSCGYPFYPGEVEYTAKIKVTGEMLQAEKIVLKVGTFNGCSLTAAVNGVPAGHIERDPYTLTLDKNMLVPDEDNEIRLRLLGTFRNMFGPSHMVDHEVSDGNKGSWCEDFEQNELAEYDIGHITDSFQLIPYGVGELSLELHYRG